MDRSADPLWQTLLDLLDVGVLVVDASGRAVQANPAARELLAGVPPDALPLDTILRGEVIRAREITLDGPAGPCRLRLSAAPVRDHDAVVGAVAVLHDASQPASSGQEEFARRIAHDMRQPLTGLIAQSEVLMMRLERLGNAPALDNVRGLRLAAGRIDRIIDDLYDAAHGDTVRERLAPVPTDLGAFVAEIVARVGSPADRDRLHVETDGAAPLALIDPYHAGRAVEHVVANALRYSPPRTPVHVRVGSAIGAATIRVVDSGRGVAPDVLPRIFDRFVGVGERHGAGLGLYVARLVTRAHGGDVEAVSQPGGGSSFVLRFPLA